MTVVTQVRCIDSAREVARLAARGDGRAEQVGRAVLPGAQITVQAGEGTVTARVAVEAPLLPLTLSSRAVAAVEPGVRPG